MNSTFTEKAWSDYLSWQKQDKKTLKRSLRRINVSYCTGKIDYGV